MDARAQYSFLTIPGTEGVYFSGQKLAEFPNPFVDVAPTKNGVVVCKSFSLIFNRARVTLPHFPLFTADTLPFSVNFQSKAADNGNANAAKGFSLIYDQWPC